MLFAPISEIPMVGRNPPYILTFIVFVALCVPTALVNNFAGLLVLRFLLGFFGSPCLATGGASLGDIFSLFSVPYAMAGWSAFAVGGPSLAPVIAGFSIAAENWRWGQWELLWASGPVLFLMIFCMPETSASTILLRRAQRLRKLTGNANLQSKSEIEQGQLSTGSMAREALWRPLQINLFDPVILFTSIYTMVVYGIYYSFFEVFPIVYIERHGFNAGQLGLVFLSILVALFITIVIYFTYLRKVFEPEVRLHGLGPPERRLIPALPASFLPPIGLFMFGWTGIATIHWIVPTIGIVIYTIGVLLILLCLFIYIPMSYPQYAASLFAANDLFRSAFAAGAVLYSRPMYLNLGVGQGCSLMGGLCVGCIGGMFALYYYGAAMRARSKFTAK
jgi:DHA1 family multidrug resistance protein-like MFS transporter